MGPEQDPKLLTEKPKIEEARPSHEENSEKSETQSAKSYSIKSSIHRPGASACFNVSGTPKPVLSEATPDAYTKPKKPFPDRRIHRRPLEDVSEQTLEDWAALMKLEPALGPLIETREQRMRVLRLLYTYRHLNREDLRDLPCTDLMTHRVRIAQGTKPASARSQKRWPPHTEWWLRKLVQDGLEGGIYELTEPANGRLSQWNARAVMVDKSDNPKPEDEPRMTFDYSRVTEDLPGCFLELSSKVHDHLANPRHGCLFMADLKHAYLTVPLHPDDRQYFAFTISGIGQLQPTRMQQGSQSAGFTMTELVYRAFGPIPRPDPEPSLLHSPDPSTPPPLAFYMDDFFGGFQDFEELYAFLRDHFFPRVEWAKLLLSFKKLRLFATEIKALGVSHRIGGHIKILEERVEKIAKWPVPRTQSEVRAFLGVVGITRRWVKNFAELARPLSRLTGKVEWRWTEAEQLSFEILRLKCATKSSMHGIDLSLPIHFYTDASGYAAGLVITQSYQDQSSSSSHQSKKQIVEAPIIYDSFSFNPCQRKYPTYKRELCAIVKFCSKYDYLCKHPYQKTIIHTDHRPLIHFLTSDTHEGVYGNWADQLRRLNITIQYITGIRNKVADGLSRTIFDDDDHGMPEVRPEAKWLWKDGKDGYGSFLHGLNEQELEEVLDQGTLKGMSVFMAQPKSPDFTFSLMPKESYQNAYRMSSWFGSVYACHEQDHGTMAVLPEPAVASAALSYRLDHATGVLWKDHRGKFVPCIPESFVLEILRIAHDRSGHWGKTGTMAKLRGYTYWPDQSQDVEKYIAGCIECAKHGPAQRSQLLHPVTAQGPFRLLGMDFIGPLPASANGSKYILHLICYFTRFSITSPRKTANAEDVIAVLREVFVTYGKPEAFYLDSGQHFTNREVQEFLRSEGIAFSYSPSGSSNSTGMVESSNRILEDILRKGGDWEIGLPKTTESKNSRVIRHLNAAPCEIFMGIPPAPDISRSFRPLMQDATIRDQVTMLVNPQTHASIVNQYITYRSQLHDRIAQLSAEQKEREALRYNRGVRQEVFEPGDLAMIYQKNTKKLEPRWRGPFSVEGFASIRGVSYTLRQLNGRKIKGSFHGNHLKSFIPREAHLADHSNAFLPEQTIRARKRRRVRLILRPPKPPEPDLSGASGDVVKVNHVLARAPKIETSLSRITSLHQSNLISTPLIRRAFMTSASNPINLDPSDSSQDEERSLDLYEGYEYILPSPEPEMSSSTYYKTADYAIQKSTQERTTRWEPGKPRNREYYYDEPVPTMRLKKKDTDDDGKWPPRKMDLSSAWVAVILKSDLTGKERQEKWPYVFDSKYLQKHYVQKGQAAKIWSDFKGCYVYQIGCNNWELHGDEGRIAGLPAILKEFKLASMNQDHDLREGTACANQTLDYPPHMKATDSSSGQAQIQPAEPSKDTKAEIQKSYDAIAQLRQEAAGRESSRPKDSLFGPPAQPSFTPESMYNSYMPSQYQPSGYGSVQPNPYNMFQPDPYGMHHPSSYGLHNMPGMHGMQQQSSYGMPHHAYPSMGSQSNLIAPQSDMRSPSVKRESSDSGSEFGKRLRLSSDAGSVRGEGWRNPGIRQTEKWDADQPAQSVEHPERVRPLSTQAQLSNAESKVIMSAITISGLHRVLVILQDQVEKTIKGMRGQQNASAQIKSIKSQLDHATEQQNRVIAKFGHAYPMMATRVFRHTDDDESDLREWARAPQGNFGRLHDDDDYNPGSQDSSDVLNVSQNVESNAEKAAGS